MATLAEKQNGYYLIYMAARLWHKAPFVRLLLALAAGVLVQWYLQLPLTALFICLGCCLALTMAYAFSTVKTRYRLQAINGTSLFLFFACVGGIAVWLHDIRKNPGWFGHQYQEGDYVMVTLEEPLVEKANSYKAVATVNAFYKQKNKTPVTGSLILYFKKDSLFPAITYGSQLLLSQSLQAIKNAGNPGSFDYKRYSLFEGITHQVYLTAQDYVVLPFTNKNRLKQFLFDSRSWVIGTLKNYIPGEKEQGLAEALLIGYKNDLDKNLVQAYSNTGVVHIIAISGLHLGLIYVILLLFTKPLKRIKRLLWLRLSLIVASLWLFSLLAGASPSVLRSALMFSLIAIGDSTFRKTNIFNTLAFSAFVLLCVNPFWLWDVGFQLSYAAVLSIVLFFQPVYNWFSFQNKGVVFLWKLTSVTIAAQVFTLPISIYHFHQMPLLFLVTNFVAVPLSSFILVGEILLCALAVFPTAASLIGTLLHEAIYFMNNYIEGLDSLSFSVWNGLSLSIVQTALLLSFSFFVCYWLLEKQRRYAWTAFGSLALFMVLRGISFTEAYNQKKLIVYNVPKHPAIDIINGRSYAFLGDSALLSDGFERNFHLQPSRILHRISPVVADMGVKQFALAGKQFIVLDAALLFAADSPKKKIDVMVLSKNPKLQIAHLSTVFSIGQIVLDGSVPPWRAVQWKKECDSLHIPCFDVNEKGAFVMNW